MMGAAQTNGCREICGIDGTRLQDRKGAGNMNSFAVVRETEGWPGNPAAVVCRVQSGSRPPP